MKSKILFLAPYPNLQSTKEGMISRVKAIDTFFQDEPRTYLLVAPLFHRKKNLQRDGLAEVYKLNLIFHFWTILRLIKSHKHIYSHSILMLSFVWMFINKKTNSLTLDIHGVVPEEEKHFNKRPLWAKYYAWIEPKIFRRLTNAICVTNSMVGHYQKKYPFFTGKYIIYSIIPVDLRPPDDYLISEIKKENSDTINILYSGGVQGWQNIDLMLKTIMENRSLHIQYTILTGDIAGFKHKMEQNNIDPATITLESRNPQDLWKDYLKADYAFILRDDNIVNNVANPTKLVEYLYYGLTPIILSPRIGDFEASGYEYLKLSDFNAATLVKPSAISEKNVQIATALLKANQNIDFNALILG